MAAARTAAMPSPSWPSRSAGWPWSLRGDGYTPFVLALVALATIVGVGLNILVGLTGQVSIGHVGFYAIGAYAVGDPDAAGRELLAGAARRRGRRRRRSARCWPCRPCACPGPTSP